MAANICSVPLKSTHINCLIICLIFCSRTSSTCPIVDIDRVTAAHTHTHTQLDTHTQHKSSGRVIGQSQKRQIPMSRVGFCLCILLYSVLYFIHTCFFVLFGLHFAFCRFYLQHTTQTFMPPAGFEPASPAIAQPQTYALVRTATGMLFKIPKEIFVSSLSYVNLINDSLEPACCLSRTDLLTHQLFLC
jgi:hypothetical protein